VATIIGVGLEGARSVGAVKWGQFRKQRLPGTVTLQAIGQQGLPVRWQRIIAITANQNIIYFSGRVLHKARLFFALSYPRGSCTLTK
jgi:hypothetical protein